MNNRKVVYTPQTLTKRFNLTEKAVKEIYANVITPGKKVLLHQIFEKIVKVAKIVR